MNKGVIFIDLDGTILSQCELKDWDPYRIEYRSKDGIYGWYKQEDINLINKLNKEKEEYNSKVIQVLPDVKEKLIKWHVEGYRIIITTARPESLRKITIQTLDMYGLLYNDIIMDLPQGPRYLINNIDTTSSEHKAIAYNVLTNKGLGNIDL